MRGEFEYYILLIMSALVIEMTISGCTKNGSLFDRAIIKDTSILRRIPIIRKLVEKQPYYARVIPILIAIAVFLIVFVIYICFWIYPPSVASFLGSMWAKGFSFGYCIVIAVYIITI